jgi:hypothetical protein
MKKKMKRYEAGGDVVELQSKTGRNENIGDDVRARAMAAMEKGSSDEPAAPKKSAAKPTPKAEAPAPKAEPKAAAPTPKAEKQKTSGEEPSFLKGTKGFKNLGSMFKAMREKAGITSYKSGGSVSSASSRADGCITKGKTKGRMV